MKQQGFTLIELILVVAIITVLAAALAFEFVGWQERYTSESEIQTMQNDLMTVRTYAMQQNTSYFVQLTNAKPEEYDIYMDKDGSGDLDTSVDTKITSLSRQGLSKQLTSNSGVNPTTITMDRRGMVQVPPTAPASGMSIWLLKDDGNPYGFLDAAHTKPEIEYDCIFLAGTRILVGKYDDTKDPVCQAK